MIEAEKTEQFRMFVRWLNVMFRSVIDDEAIERIVDVKEVKSMLSKVVDEILDTLAERTEVESVLSEVMKEMYENGRQQGRSEGIREGKRHGFRVTKVAIATTLLKNGFPVPEVVEITGIDRDEVLRRAAGERKR